MNDPRMRNTGCSWPIATIYIMQGEIYSDMPYGQHGSAEFSVEMLLRNARNISSSKAIGTLSWHHPLQAKVGERVRIFFGVGGPNRTSSFQVIGEIFDKVYALRGLETAPLEGIQTVTVPPGRGRHHRIQNTGAGQVYTGRSYLARAERGLLGILGVEGSPNPDVYNGQVMPGMGH